MNPEQMQQPEQPQDDSQLMVFLGEIADKLEEINTKVDSLMQKEDEEMAEAPLNNDIP